MGYQGKFPNHWRVIILGLIGGLVFLTAVASARELTLKQSVDLAVALDPETQDAKRKEEIGKVKRSKAVQDYLPKIDLYMTTGPQIDYFGRPVTDKDVFYEGVGLEQPLYKGGTLTRTVKLAESETRRGQWDFETRRLGVAADTIKAYYEVLTAQAVIEQYTTLVAHGAEDLRETQTRLEAGKVTRAEVLDLEVKLLEAQQKLSKARADHQVKISSLKKLTGLGDEEPVTIASQYPLEDIRANLDSLLDEAQGRRPDLKMDREEVTYNQLKTEIEERKRWPQVSFIGRYEWENPLFMSGKKDWLVMLKASVSFDNTTLSYTPQRTELYPNIFGYPVDVLNPLTPLKTFAYNVNQIKYSIFDRSSNKVDLEEAKAARELARGKWSQLQRQIYYEVKDAHTQKEDSTARMATAEKQVALGREILAINSTKFTAGYATKADVFKARATLAEAQVNLLTAQNDKATALGKLYKALGRDLMFQRSGL